MKLWTPELLRLVSIALIAFSRSKHLKNQHLRVSQEPFSVCYAMAEHEYPVSESRRQFLFVGTVGMSALVRGPAMAASQARVQKYPGLEYLEPIYELQLSVSALQSSAGDANKWHLLKQRLEKFFGGGLFSERNYYAGVGVQYMNQMEYDKNELKEYVRLDKEARFNAMEDTLNSLEAIKNELQKDSPDAAFVRSNAEAASAAISRWFANIPDADRRAVADLYIAVRKADQNRDGRLSDSELALLDETDQAVWKRRIKLVGG